jgi:hypothetical protein
MRTTLLISLTALAVIATAPAIALAEEEHRELGAHVHGHGTLSVAVENTSVAMELEVPGMDIVGFEHEAESAEQKAAVAKAKDDLSNPLALFKFPESAACSVKEAKVEVETEHHEGEGHDSHAKAEDHDGDKHADADHAGEEHEGHNAFHVTYALDCSKPANLTSIAFDYFKAFAGAQGLTVNVVTAKAQNSFEVSRDKPVLDLGGMM